MTKHTPGPWEAYNGEVTTRRIPGRSFRRIAAVQDYGIGSLPEVDEANAKLIAAAPDLLAAWQAMEPMFDNDSPLLTVYATEIKAIRAAIAKATA